VKPEEAHLRAAIAAVVLSVSVGQMPTMAHTDAAGDAGAKAPAVAAPAEPEGFWTGPVNDPVPHTIKGGKVIHTQALAVLLHRQHAATDSDGTEQTECQHRCAQTAKNIDHGAIRQADRHEPAGVDPIADDAIGEL